jgi:hypothetical protein
MRAAPLLLFVACGSSEPGDAATSSASAAVVGSGAVLEAAENESGPLASSTAKAAADPIVSIAAQKLSSGSTPGDRGRDPTLEPASVAVDLGAFDIDRAPYPNEPGKKPLTGVTRERASELCKARGRRMCSELEWELACKGPESHAYAGGAGWLSDCKSGSCASGFGAIGMGSIREWTASDVAAVDDVKGGASVRGAARSASELDRRCAHRTSVSPSTEDADLGFRCCGGDANEASIAAPKKLANFEKATLSPSDLSAMFASTKELAKLGRDIKYFDPETSAKEVTQKGDAGADPKGYELVTHPLAWRPVTGEDIVVVTGQAGEDSFIVALFRLADGRYRVASSLVLRRDPGPIVLAYDRSVDSRLEWATCFHCPGESGRITYRDDKRVVITQE